MPITDGLDQALINSAFTLLRADLGPPPLVVIDGPVPAGTSVTGGYVVVYAGLSRPSDDPDNALAGRTAVWIARWICHCVGGTPTASRAVAQRVRTALLDVSPAIPGFGAVGLIRMEGDETPPQPDELSGQPVLDTIVTYRLRATS
jgi:hypothetical protein